ncbi:DUF1707 and DUF4190 domain-containing protein [Kitasatospora azatica]|uniref:DUF1707 and DUF4190 domain-containing protein n=1 Tax=Kitasatospora azatica TaxID=58347 RepID=UPI000B190094|nr:DUF1707 and DUF4190 domain-containing protein [Kitasatospora azatica]
MGDVQPWPGSGHPGYPAQQAQPMAAQAQPMAQMRAAHTDRDRTVDVLKAAYAEGRLSAEEYSDRFDAANRAQTYGQLAQLVADLPAGPVVTPMAAPMAAPMAMPVPPTFLPPTRPAPNNGLAISALVFGLLCVPSVGTLAIPAVVTGHLARRQIRQTKESGDGMATFGLVLGYLSLAGWSLLLLLGAVAFSAHGG